MKRLIIAAAGLMMFGLIIAIYIYESSDQLKLPQYILQESTNESERLQPIYVDDDAAYSLQNDELNITFNQGRDWIKVPIKKDQLFNGRYVGNKQELIEHSYMLTEKRIAFLYAEGSNEIEEDKRILVTYSLDQGNTWIDSVVTELYASLGFRKVDYLSEQFGYVIISGERIVSQEASYIYVTNDGGANWKKLNHPDTMSLVLDGGFVDEMTGFLSVGPINPDKPELHVTQDGGNTWSEATVNVPEEYSEIFLIAEMPVIEDSHLAVLANQSPNGDYEGGKVKGKFISKDNGSTWEFLEEVRPNENEAEYRN